MPDQDPLLPYVRAWAEAKAAGRNPTPEELCRDRPDLVGPLAARLASLRTDPTFATPDPLGYFPAPPEPDPDYHQTQSRSAPPAGGVPVSEFPSQVDNFRLIQVLGKGGMGAVFRAEDIRLGRQVAVKLILPTYAANPKAKLRFMREAKAQGDLNHDYITPIYQIGEQDGILFIVMPLLQGETLRGRIKREGTLPLRDVMKIGRELAEGLAAAHARGVVHRDMKPGNVWLEGDLASANPAERFRRCRILDFGLVARANEEANARVTGAGEVLGTPAYMSPEQAAGMPVDERTDLFSLGVILYELVTGKQPFEGTSVVSSLVNVATVVPPPAKAVNPDVPEPLSDLIERMMSKTPGLRPLSARVIADDLRRLTDELFPPTASAPPLRERLGGPTPPTRQGIDDSTSWSDDGLPAVAAAGVPGGSIGIASGQTGMLEAVVDTKRGGAATVGRPPRVPNRPPAAGAHVQRDRKAGGPPAWVWAAGGLAAVAVVGASVYFANRPTGPVVPAVPETVEVRITSTPAGATVTPVDPAAAARPPADARTPATYAARPERHEVEVSKPGYESRRVVIDPREKQDYEVTLTAARAVIPPPPRLKDVTVRVTNPAAGVTVLADVPGLVRAEPAGPGVFVFSPAPAKTFTARVSAEGYVPRDVTVNVDAGTDYPVTLVPARMRVTFVPFPDGTTAAFPAPADARPDAKVQGRYDVRRRAWDVRVRVPGRREVAVTVAPPPAGDGEVVVTVPLLFEQTLSDPVVGIALQRIPAGSFMMPFVSNGQNVDKKVTITKPFYLGRTEVTRRQFRQFIVATGDHTDARKAGGAPGYVPGNPDGVEHDPKFNWQATGFTQEDDHPVVNVSWNDAKAFCDWMTTKTGRRYRLPTEAEWEYAAKAGADGPLPFDLTADVLLEHANVADATLRRRLATDNPNIKIPEKGFYPLADGFAFTAPVGTYRPNAFGLVDTFGNVAEWCEDWYGDPASLGDSDPVQTKPDPDGRRVARGGSFRADSLRALIGRYRLPAGKGNIQTGFRVCVEIDEPAGK